MSPHNDDPSHAVTHTSTDLLIVGAGPTGLFGAYYAGYRGMSVTVLDSLPEPGGQISAMYPEKEIFDVAGFPAVRGRDLVERLLEQAAPFAPHYLLGQRAETLEQLADTGQGPGGFLVTTHQGMRIRAGAVLITGGIGTFTPRPLPAAAGYQGSGVAYFVRQLKDYDGTDVVIVGGGDSAFDWAAALHRRAASVTVIHRRDSFRAHPATVAAVRAAGVRVVTGAEVSKLIGNGHVEAVEVAEADGQRYEVPCQRIIAALGFTAQLGPLLRWGIAIENRRHIPVDSAMRTSLPGVFAAGDINDYPGKVRLIAVGFGEAATAVNNAAHLIDPGQPVFPGHSTDHSTVAVAAA